MEEGADTSRFHQQASEIGSTPDIDANRHVSQLRLPEVGQWWVTQRAPQNLQTI